MTGSRGSGADVAVAMVLAVLLMVLTVYLVGEGVVLRWYAVPTGLGAVVLSGWVVHTATRSARVRRAARADGVAEQMAQVGTWCGQLSEHLRIPERQRELTQGTRARLARVITQGERALATWSSGPAGRRRLGRLENLTGRLLPEMAAVDRRARHEHLIAVRGRRA